MKAMEEKNKAALAQWGPKKILADFINLPDKEAQTSVQRLKAFWDRYGPLLWIRELAGFVLPSCDHVRRGRISEEARAD